MTWTLLRKRVERDLAECAEKDRRHAEGQALQRLLDEIPIGCLVAAGGGRLLYQNSEAARLLGLSLGEDSQCPEWILHADAGEDWRVHRQGEGAPAARLLYQTVPMIWGEEESARLVLLEDGGERSLHGAHENRQDRLAAVGQLAAGLAHEIGNPITIIQSCASFLHDEHREGPLGEDLEVIEREAGRCREMLDQMLALASARQHEPLEGDLRECVHRAVGLVRYKAEGVSLNVSLPPDPVAYIYDESQFSAILVNLLLNAVASTKSAARREVRLQLLVENGVIGLKIEDSGCGIPPDQLDRVFDPFFTQRDGGTGLGLAMVYQVISALGGSIDVASTVNEGTCFTITLPFRESSQA